MDQQRLALLKRKLEALSYDGELDTKSAPLAEKLVDDLVEATNSYRSLKIRVTKQQQDIESWSSKMEVMRRENGKALKENSALHMELIRKDEVCDERLRSAADESRALENAVAELGFWKRAQIEKYASLESNFEACKEKLNDVITGTYAFSKVPGEDIKARMDLSHALRQAVRNGPGGDAERSRAEELVAVADERASALQRRLVESEQEMQRMQREVDTARRATAARENEVKRLNGMLDNATDVDVLALRELGENKDALIESLSLQAEDLIRRIIELENDCDFGGGAVRTAMDTGVAVAEPQGKRTDSESRVAALQQQLAAARVALDEKGTRPDDGGDVLADALSSAAALRRELAVVAAARDDAEATVVTLKASGGNSTAAAKTATPVADGPDDRVTEAETARDAAELRAVEAAAEARRAQTLLMDTMRELERVRAFAEQSEEQRGEVIAAAKAAAEVLARHEAASGDQAFALEALNKRARGAEAETQRLGRMLMEAAEEREQLLQELRFESEGRSRAVATAAAASAPDSHAAVARDEVVARLVRELEEARAGRTAAQEAAAFSESRQGGVDASSLAADRRVAEAMRELEAEREARARAEASLDAAEAAAAAARGAAETAAIEAATRAREAQLARAEREDAKAEVAAAARQLAETREMLRRDSEAAGARRDEVDEAGREVDQLKALVSGLDATRADLVLSLKAANARTRDTQAKLVDAENEAVSARGKEEEAVTETKRARAVIAALASNKDRLESELDAKAEKLNAADTRAHDEAEQAEEARRAAAAAESRAISNADARAAAERRLDIAEERLASAKRADEENRAQAAARREELRAAAEDLAAMTREQQVVNAELLRLSREHDELVTALEESKEFGRRTDAAARNARKETDDVVGAYQELGAENRRLAAAASALERDGARARVALDAGEAALAQAHARIRTVEGENKQYVVDLQAFERQADGLSRALSESERAGDGATRETSGLRDQLAAAQAIAAELERAREQSQRDVAGAEASLHVARARLADSQGEAETSGHRLRLESNRVRELEGLLASVRQREHKVEVTSADSDARLSNVLERSRILEEQAYGLETQIQTLQSQREAAESEASTLRIAIEEKHGGASLAEMAAVGAAKETKQLRARVLEAERAAAAQAQATARATEDAAKLRKRLEDASHEAVAAQQQAAMARRELAAATHREAILAAQAENAAVSAEDSKRALEEATLKVSRENLATASPARKPTQSQAAENPDDASRATARERLEEVERRAAALEMELRAAAKESGEGAAAVAAFSAQVDSLRDENAKLLELVAAAGDAGTVAAEAAALKQALAKSEETRTAIESDFQALMDSVEGLKASAATATGNDPESNQGGDADAKLTALEMENASLKSNLAGTEEACEGMQRELQRIQTEYNALASTLSGTLDTSNEEEEEEF